MPRSEFSILFEQSADIYDALRLVLLGRHESVEEIDPTEVLRAITTARPDISLSRAELLQAVAGAAAEVGVLLKVAVPGDEKAKINQVPLDRFSLRTSSYSAQAVR